MRLTVIVGVVPHFGLHNVVATIRKLAASWVVLIGSNENTSHSDAPKFTAPLRFQTTLEPTISRVSTMASASRNEFGFHQSCLLPQAEVLRYAVIGKLKGARGKSFSVDLSQVEEADISFLQLLVSLKRTAAARQIALTVLSNPYVDALLARAGLTNWHLDGAPADQAA